jgi:hypothetical protein
MDTQLTPPSPDIHVMGAGLSPVMDLHDVPYWEWSDSSARKYLFLDQGENCSDVGGRALSGSAATSARLLVAAAKTRCNREGTARTPSRNCHGQHAAAWRI